MLTEMSHTEGKKYCMTSLIRGILKKKIQSIDTDNSWCLLGKGAGKMSDGGQKVQT